MTIERDRIFISYRRSDAAGTTTALRNALVQDFGSRLFHDVTGIPIGAPFPDVLHEQLNRAAIVLAVIGENWLSARNEFHQRRIDYPDDWVNIELSTALGAPEVTVIPVLVDAASMPPAKALPAELAALATRNAVHLRHEAWDETIRPLFERIKEILSPGEDKGSISSETQTSNTLFQVVLEALDSRAWQLGSVLLATIDEISRILANVHNASGADPDQVRNFLCERLLGRRVVEVAGYVKEIFRYNFAVSTSNGNWLGYALREIRPHSAILRYRDCLLLLPGSDGRIAGVSITDQIEWDFYGMQSNDNLPYVSNGSVTGVGIAFEGVTDAFPPKLSETLPGTTRSGGAA